MENLIERLEKATGPNFALEQDIWCAVYAPDAVAVDHNFKPPPYTYSIDAALTLVPEGFRTMHAAQDPQGGWYWGLHMDAGHPKNPSTTNGISFAAQYCSDEFHDPTGRANAAIAICIAALKARNAQL